MHLIVTTFPNPLSERRWNASFTYGSWFANDIDVHTEVGAPISGFEASGRVFLASSRRTDTGPRP